MLQKHISFHILSSAAAMFSSCLKLSLSPTPPIVCFDWSAHTHLTSHSSSAKSIPLCKNPLLGIHYSIVSHGDIAWSHNVIEIKVTTDEAFQGQCFPWERRASVGVDFDSTTTYTKGAQYLSFLKSMPVKFGLSGHIQMSAGDRHSDISLHELHVWIWMCMRLFLYFFLFCRCNNDIKPIHLYTRRYAWRCYPETL